MGRTGWNSFTHSHGGINILMLFEDFLSIFQLLLCFSEQSLENDLWDHSREQPNASAQQTKLLLYGVPADLQVLFDLSQRLHFVLSMASLQQTVATHVQPLINAVVAQYLCVLWALSLGEVPQWIHQQVRAERLPLQMGLEVFGTQWHFTPQAGLDSQRWLSFAYLRGAAVTQHLALLFLALGAGKATFSVTLVAPGLTNAGRAEAVTTGQGVGLAEGVSTHGAGQLLLQGRHGQRMKRPRRVGHNAGN